MDWTGPSLHEEGRADVHVGDYGRTPPPAPTPLIPPLPDGGADPGGAGQHSSAPGNTAAVQPRVGAIYHVVYVGGGPGNDTAGTGQSLPGGGAPR